ncbi:hypothetical protein GOV12_05195 [Candidatus Pacearchaeota archaeon]|nr:hypothetical protein [Candidatus Pacearchaeota archaeon]
MDRIKITTSKSPLDLPDNWEEQLEFARKSQTRIDSCQSVTLLLDDPNQYATTELRAY